MTSIDRAGAVVGLITLREDKNALEASEGLAADSRAEAASMIGGDVTVETFEQVVGEIGNPPPAEGCLVRFVSFQTDPARVAIIVSDEDALRAAEAGFEARREKDEAHGMRFGEITHREVVLVDNL